MIQITDEQHRKLMKYLETVPKAGFSCIAETIEFCNIVFIIDSKDKELNELQKRNLLVFLKKASLTGKEAEEYSGIVKAINGLIPRSEEDIKNGL